MSKKVLYIEVTSTDADITDMDYDEVADFTCELMNDELGKWGLSYKPIPEDDYYSTGEIKKIIMDFKSKEYRDNIDPHFHEMRSYMAGINTACNRLLKIFLKIDGE